MDKFNLHEWIGKGEKNLLNEARDDEDYNWMEDADLEGHEGTGRKKMEEDELEEGQLNEGSLDDLIKAIFGSAAKEAVKKKSEEEVKSLHKKIFGFDYKDRNKKGRG